MDDTVLMYHPNLTGEGSKDHPVKVRAKAFPIHQASGWKRARVRTTSTSSSETSSTPTTPDQEA